MSITSHGTLIGDRYGSITWNVEEDGTVTLAGHVTFTHEGFAAALCHLEPVAVDARNLHAIHTEDREAAQ